MHKVHHIKCKTDNCYIVESEGNAILVDTASGDALDNWISPATGHLNSNIDDIKDTAKKFNLWEREQSITDTASLLQQV